MLLNGSLSDMAVFGDDDVAANPSAAYGALPIVDEASVMLSTTFW